MSPRDPVTILKAIEAACQECTAALQRQPEAANVWSGIAFRIGSSKLVAALGEVLEVIDYPEITRVPRTQSWLLGIANMRGSLLPVIDLQSCLHGKTAPLTQKSRVLVIRQNDVFSGLLVDEVLGIKYFTETDIVESGIAVDAFLHPYVSHGYSKDRQCWGVFSISALTQAAGFLQVAV
ncbi:MAG: chemotaxis protein CheW [Gammaproteobacteria bacterium]|jgi:twitching motility protein PilI